MITNRNEAKTLVKYFLCDCKRKFNRTTCNSNKKWDNKTCQCECKNYRACKKDYSCNPSTCICENGKYLKSKVDDSKIVFDEIMFITDIMSIKMTNTKPTNVTSFMNCYILHTVLLVFILLLIIAIFCYHYAKNWSKQKGLDALTK